MIHEKIQSINDAILARSTKIEVAIHGLAKPIYITDDDGEVMIPAVVIDGMDDAHVFIDDDYLFGLYHKVNSKTYATDPRQGYGDNDKVTVTFDMSMIVWGFEKHITAVDLERFIFSISPNEVDFLKTDFDTKRVFNSEFSRVDFFVPEDVFLMKINYKVQAVTLKRCLEIPTIFK